MKTLMMQGPAGALVILGLVSALVASAVMLGVGAAIVARVLLG